MADIPTSTRGGADMGSTAGADTIGIRDLRARMASVIRRAAAGDAVIVTVDGRAAARIGPLAPTGGVSLADLVACGLVDPPGRPDRPPAPTPAMVPVDLSAERVLAEVRR